MVTSRPILGDIVTAYEITPSGEGKEPEPAKIDDEVVRQIYEKLMEASQKLTETIKSQTSG